MTGSPRLDTASEARLAIVTPSSQRASQLGSMVATRFACAIICTSVPCTWSVAPLVAACQRSVCFHAFWAEAE